METAREAHTSAGGLPFSFAVRTALISTPQRTNQARPRPGRRRRRLPRGVFTSCRGADDYARMPLEDRRGLSAHGQAQGLAAGGVMVAAMDTPSATSMTTSSFTAPGAMRETVPASRLRAEKRAPSASVTTTMDEALTSANACAPTARPRPSALVGDDGHDAGRAHLDLDLVVDGAVQHLGDDARKMVPRTGLHTDPPDQQQIIGNVGGLLGPSAQ